MRRPGLGQHVLERRRAIAPAVIGQHPLDLHSQLGEPGQGSGHEPGRGLALLIGQGLNIGQPGPVIDRRMQLVIAGLAPPMPPTLGPPEQSVTAPLRDAPLGLDVDMEQLPGPLTLRAHHLAAGSVQLGQPGQPVTDQHRMDGGAGLPRAQPIRCGPTR